MRSGLSTFSRSASVLGLIVGGSGAAISMWVDKEETTQRSDPSSHHTPRLSQSRENLRVPRQHVAENEWADKLRTEEFWRGSRALQTRPSVSPPQRTVRSRPERQRAIRARVQPRGTEDGQHARYQDHNTYRTVCVRLCDGYFWPISFSADSTTIASDRKQCEQSCAAPARLYISKDINVPLEDMRDEGGRYYRDLNKAFVYRSAYLPNCKCKPHPWEEEARARHEQYAKQASRTSTEAVRRR
jgi:hypothetical protein